MKFYSEGSYNSDCGGLRKILHLDLDAFYCAVEEQRDPSLRGKPLAVGGRPESRGVVASCSYAARLFGVHSALPMSRAVRLCPALMVVPPRHDVYKEVSREVMACLHQMTPLVEQLSIDEAFLDVSELKESAERLARQLQKTINRRLGLPCSLGVATNKLVAKIANTIGKASVKGNRPPNTVKVVPPGLEAAFLAPLPVGKLWGVGPRTAELLAQMGVHTIGDLARRSEREMTGKFGKNGHDLVRRSRGIDNRPVAPERETKSVSQETTFPRDVSGLKELLQTLGELSEKVSRRLRQKELRGITIKIKLRWADFTTLTRQTTLDHATDGAEEIYSSARRLLESAWNPGTPVRLVGVGVSHFETSPAVQLCLWDGLEEKRGNWKAGG